MTVTPHPCGAMVRTGAWPFARWMIVAPDGYPVGGNLDSRHGTGAAMLAAARQNLKKGLRP